MVIDDNLSLASQEMDSNWVRKFHRRMIYTEEKAKVVAAAGSQIDSIPCRASIFAPGRFEDKNHLILG